MRQPDIIKQLEAARLNAGLDEAPDANIDTRGVIKTTDTSLPDDLDPGVLPKIEEEKKILDLDPGVLPKIEEEQEIIPELSDWCDDDSDDDRVYEEDAVEDIPEPVI